MIGVGLREKSGTWIVSLVSQKDLEDHQNPSKLTRKSVMLRGEVHQCQPGNVAFIGRVKSSEVTHEKVRLPQGIFQRLERHRLWFRGLFRHAALLVRWKLAGVADRKHQRGNDFFHRHYPPVQFRHPANVLEFHKISLFQMVHVAFDAGNFTLLRLKKKDQVHSNTTFQF